MEVTVKRQKVKYIKWFLITTLITIPLVALAATPKVISIQGAPVIMPQQVIQIPTPDQNRALVLKMASRYGINPKVALWIAGHESGFDSTRTGDNGTSYGIWQIHLPAWPEITVASATDPVWSTEWAMQKILDGKDMIWSTYSMCHVWYQDCPL